MEIVNILPSAATNHDVLFAAFISVVGAVISGIIVAWVTKRQISSQRDTALDQMKAERERAMDERLFVARRESYERLLGLFFKAYRERFENKAQSMFLGDNDAIERIGEATLWFSDHFRRSIDAYIAFLHEPLPPAHGPQKDIDNIGLKAVWQQVVEAARDELGMGSLLTDFVPPADEKSET